MTSGPEGPEAAKDDVLSVKGTEGALSLEFISLREGVARGFLRFSPRNLRLSPESSRAFVDELGRRPYSRILVLDNKRDLLRKALVGTRWKVERAISASLKRKCQLVSTYDFPIDETLLDSNGMKPDLANTSGFSGIRAEIGGREAWAFYTDDGETARIISEGERRQGMLVASRQEDMFELADSLICFLAAARKSWAFYTDEGETARIISEGERRQGMLVASRQEDMFELADSLICFLAAARKSWAVFSMDLGRYIRHFDPITLSRMVLDRPKPFVHSAKPVSNGNRKQVVGLFSEYYDESRMQSVFRLKRLRADRNFAVYALDGGFVITRLDGVTGLVYDIYVTPGRQGEGLGEELMRCALTDLAGKTASVYLHTSYPRARRLYEKFGFKVTYSQLGVRLDELAITSGSAR